LFHVYVSVCGFENSKIWPKLIFVLFYWSHVHYLTQSAWVALRNFITAYFFNVLWNGDVGQILGWSTHWYVENRLCSAFISFLLYIHLPPRFVFRPIEESAYLFFSQLWRRGVDPAAQDPDCVAKVRLGLFRLLRLLVLLGKRGIQVRPFGRIRIPDEQLVKLCFLFRDTK
jgi:hypothetical protein